MALHRELESYSNSFDYVLRKEITLHSKYNNGLDDIIELILREILVLIILQIYLRQFE